MSHKELVEIMYKYMLKNMGVGIAFKELASVDREIPDVIGFDSWKSLLIECKVSRADFLKDKKKKHREKGMGNWRYYACPAGLIKVDELPEKWGLIYVNEKGKARIEYDCQIKSEKKVCTSEREFEIYPSGTYIQRTRHNENKFEADMTAERAIFYTALRRLFIKGHVKHIYDKQYNRSNTANDLINLNQ